MTRTSAHPASTMSARRRLGRGERRADAVADGVCGWGGARSDHARPRRGRTAARADRDPDHHPTGRRSGRRPQERSRFGPGGARLARRGRGPRGQDRSGRRAGPLPAAGPRRRARELRGDGRRHLPRHRRRADRQTCADRGRPPPRRPRPETRRSPGQASPGLRLAASTPGRARRETAGELRRPDRRRAGRPRRGPPGDRYRSPHRRAFGGGPGDRPRLRRRHPRTRRPRFARGPIPGLRPRHAATQRLRLRCRGPRTRPPPSADHAGRPRRDRRVGHETRDARQRRGAVSARGRLAPGSDGPTQRVGVGPGG